MIRPASIKRGRPVKVLAYVHAYPGSGHNAGAETTIHGLMRHMKRDGWDPMVLASKPFRTEPGSYVIDWIPVQAHSSKKDPFLYFPGQDLIVSHLECAERAYLVGKMLNKPVVQLIHNTTDFSQGISRFAHGLVFNSEATKKAVNAPQPSIVVYPPVDPEEYRVETTREYITLVNMSDGTDPWYDKGPETFYRLAERFPREKFLGVKGGYGIQDVRPGYPNVTIMEHTDHPLSIYKRSKVMLMPSGIESFGRIAVEAAASSIPSIVSDTAGLREASVGIGYLPPKDIDLWTSALSEVLWNYDEACKHAEVSSRLLWKKTDRQLDTFREFMRLAVMSNGFSHSG